MQWSERIRPQFAEIIGIDWKADYIPLKNFDVRNGEIKFVILHHTACLSVKQAFSAFLANNTSAHYLVSRKNESQSQTNAAIYNLVLDKDRAWHAGLSKFAFAEQGLNVCSIGVEVNNDGVDEPFEASQMAGLVFLLHCLKRAYNISPFAFLSHHEIAPERKADPSHLFDWKLLAHYGIGYFPQRSGVQKIIAKLGDVGDFVLEIQEKLYTWGYRYIVLHGNFDSQLRKTIESFQRRYSTAEYCNPVLQGVWTAHDEEILDELLEAKNSFELGMISIEANAELIKKHNPLRSELVTYQQQLHQMGLGFFAD